MTSSDSATEHVTFPDEFGLADYFLFDRLKDGLGDKVALRYGQRGYTYDDVAERTRALARYFQAIDVAREQRVLLVVPDGPAFAWSYFGALAHGAVVAMGNPDSPDDDLAYLLEYTRAAVLVTVPRVAEALGMELADSPYLKAVLLVPDTPTGGDCEGEVAAPEALSSASCDVGPLAGALDVGRDMGNVPLPTIRRDDEAVWLFTSGSTGRPKAAVHSHRCFAYNTENYAKRTIGWRRDDVTIGVPKLFFGYATGTNLMFPFAVGATACLFSERSTPESLAKAIEMYRPTIVTNVPTMLSKLLDYDDARMAEGSPPLDLSCVRFHTSAGEALPPSLLERFTERFGNDVYDGIGSAEMFHIYLTNRPGDSKPGSLGRAVDGYEVRILPTDAEGPGAEPVTPGELGELWVRGDSVSLGYFGDRDKSWQTYYGHWCRTGDLFRQDEDGYMWLSGRADSLFKTGGKWVAPLEVEECLLQHPAVAMSCVIPAKHEELDKPKAFVVVRDSARDRVADDATKDELRHEIQAHVRERLAMYKYPRWIVFVDDLPRNDRGKVQRKQLMDLEAQGKNPWQ